MPRTNDAAALPVYSTTLSSALPMEYASAVDLATVLLEVHPQGSWAWITTAGDAATSGIPMALTDAGNAAAALRELRADNPDDGVADRAKSYSTASPADRATRSGDDYALERIAGQSVSVVDDTSGGLVTLLEVLDDLAASR